MMEAVWGNAGLIILMGVIPFLIYLCVPRGRKLLFLTIYVALQIFCLRYWVISSTIYPAPTELPEPFVSEIIESTGDEEFENLSAQLDAIGYMEAIPDAAIHTFQTFSMDEDYTQFLILGRYLLYSQNLGTLAGLYEFYNSVLNVIAPALGGALILNLLTNLLPILRLWLYFYRPKFVFSELNKESIYLAEDLAAQPLEKLAGFLPSPPPKQFLRFFRPMFVFTDAYPDKESEEVSELIMRARDIHALCVQADTAMLSLRRSQSVVYFLMDENFGQSMEAFIRLASQKESSAFKDRFKQANKSERRVWPCSGSVSALEKQSRNSEDGHYRTKIYLFINKPESVEQVRSIQNKYNLRELLSVFTVRSFHNMSYRLAKDYPFFLPLLLKGQDENVSGLNPEYEGIVNPEYANNPLAPKNTLTVSLVGDGSTAIELLKTIFWACQIPNHELRLNLIAPDPQRFYGIIHEQCPELLQTSDVILEGKLLCAREDLLKIFPNKRSSETSPCYARIAFYSAEDFSNDLKGLTGTILKNTDYFILAVGSDQKALDLTMSLDLALSRANMDMPGDISKFIVPVIYDQNIAESIERKHTAPFENYILPIGSLESQVSVNSIFFDDLYDIAKIQGDTYALSHEKVHNVEKEAKQEYNFWSNISKGIHAPYKCFGLGNFPYTRDFAEQIISQPKILDKYTGLIRPDTEDAGFKNMVAWSEKRRWNAYTRSIGYCTPTKEQVRNMKKIYEPFAGADVDQQLSSPEARVKQADRNIGNATKNFEYKLHRCLSEVQFEIPEHNAKTLQNENELDGLDLLSLELAKTSLNCCRDQDVDLLSKFNSFEYKQYDQFSCGNNRDELMNQLYGIKKEDDPDPGSPDAEEEIPTVQNKVLSTT